MPSDAPEPGTERWRCNCDDPVVGRELADASGLKREYCGRCKKLIREVEAEIVTDGGHERLDEVGPYEDPDLAEMVFECPECGEPVAEWTQCPSCDWYDGDRWEATMRHYGECRECGQTIGGGSICDDCETLEVEP